MLTKQQAVTATTKDERTDKIKEMASQAECDRINMARWPIDKKIHWNLTRKFSIKFLNRAGWTEYMNFGSYRWQDDPDWNEIFYEKFQEEKKECLYYDKAFVCDVDGGKEIAVRAAMEDYQKETNKKRKVDLEKAIKSALHTDNKINIKLFEKREVRICDELVTEMTKWFEQNPREIFCNESIYEKFLPKAVRRPVNNLFDEHEKATVWENTGSDGNRADQAVRQ